MAVFILIFPIHRHTIVYLYVMISTFVVVLQKPDIDSTMVTMEGEQQTDGGLYMPGKDRVVFKRPEKSRLGMV